MTALLVRSPFESGDSLISLADETKRDKLLAREEEERLLAACAERSGHLRATIIGAIDTALRKSELLQLKWGDGGRNHIRAGLGPQRLGEGRR